MSIISTPLPYVFSNGTTADATQVNADFNQIVAGVNANALANVGTNNYTGTLNVAGSLNQVGAANANSLAGNTTLGAPTTGTTLTVNGAVGSDPIVMSFTEAAFRYFTTTNLSTAGNSGSGIQIEGNNGAQTGFFRTHTGATLEFGATSNDALALITNNAVRGTITASGNVLIGTTTDPTTSKLVVNGGDVSIVGSDTSFTTGAGRLFLDFAANVGSRIGPTGGGTVQAAGQYNALYYTPVGSISSAEAMRIAPSSKVLVNTTTDNGVDQLQVNGTIAATNIFTPVYWTLTGQTTTVTTTNTIPWNNIYVKSSNIITISSGVITIPVTGVYRVGAGVAISGAAGNAQAQIRIGAANQPGYTLVGPGTGATCDVMVSLAAGNLLSVFVTLSGGATANVGDPAAGYFTGQRIA